jgi:hypothetical protein
LRRTGKKRIREGNNKWKPHFLKLNPFQKTENSCKKKVQGENKQNHCKPPEAVCSKQGRLRSGVVCPKKNKLLHFHLLYEVAIMGLQSLVELKDFQSAQISVSTHRHSLNSTTQTPLS